MMPCYQVPRDMSMPSKCARLGAKGIQLDGGQRHSGSLFHRRAVPSFLPTRNHFGAVSVRQTSGLRIQRCLPCLLTEKASIRRMPASLGLAGLSIDGPRVPGPSDMISAHLCARF